MSITKQRILEAEGEELERILGEVLHNKESFEQWKTEAHAEDRMLGYKDMGKFRTLANERQLYEMYLGESPFDRIPLNWDNAMKWRDWAVKEGRIGNLHSILYHMYKADKEGIASGWNFINWLIKCKPEHYLKAAVICKLGAKT